MFVTEIDPTKALEPLTAKQVEVLNLLLQHKTTKQIARELIHCLQHRRRPYLRRQGQVGHARSQGDGSSLCSASPDL